MRLKISHTTTYSYEQPVAYGLQELRLVPKSRAGQTILNWDIDLQNAKREARFEDQNNNVVWLTSMDPGATEISVTCSGEVENTNGTGIIGKHGGYAPLWYFNRETPLTTASAGIETLISDLDVETDSLARLHALSASIADRVTYETGVTGPETTAESALRDGAGVCQDHAHIFLAAARKLGVPARYVSGYLMMNDRVQQDATHAWAEAHVPDLGWVGFDVSNQISPDERYVRVATGLDYRDAAPVSGLRVDSNAGGVESMVVDIQVQQ